jgi:uncharacterized protein
MTTPVVDIAAGIDVIDTDTHLVEPPDLWTSRMASGWGDLVPHVRWDEREEEDAWFIGGQRVTSAGAAAQAGWPEYPPDHPRRWTDADPATWEPHARLARMDEYGIHAQVLYPNVALFNSASIQENAGQDFQLAMVQAYNDYQTDFCSVAPDRLVPVTSLPFWSLPETLAEIERCAAAGHKGIVFSQDPSAFGLPQLTDRHWDPMWASAQEKGLPVNFHIASGDMSLMDNAGHPDNGPHANYASMGVSFFMGNARTIAQLICGGICHRFPALNFVSVESGVGWLPFALGALDWQWKNCGVPEEHPEYDLLPSEYFRRQIYGCFWFERETAFSAIEQIGADNIMYETDFPHPTSMSPGPASSALSPRQFISETFTDLPPDVTRKILHDNAARLYRL